MQSNLTSTWFTIRPKYNCICIFTTVGSVSSPAAMGTILSYMYSILYSTKSEGLWSCATRNWVACTLLDSNSQCVLPCWHTSCASRWWTSLVCFQGSATIKMQCRFWNLQSLKLSNSLTKYLAISINLCQSCVSIWHIVFLYNSIFTICTASYIEYCMRYASNHIICMIFLWPAASLTKPSVVLTGIAGGVLLLGILMSLVRLYLFGKSRWMRKLLVRIT